MLETTLVIKGVVGRVVCYEPKVEPNADHRTAERTAKPALNGKANGGGGHTHEHTSKPNERMTSLNTHEANNITFD